MKLFYVQRSPYARKARVVAMEKSIPLELIEVDLVDKSPELFKANPVGKIPALLLENGTSLVDSPVICEYLDSLDEHPIFFPKNKEERFRQLHFQSVADGMADATVLLTLEKRFHPENISSQFVSRQEMTIHNAMQYFENRTESLQTLTIGPLAVACAIGYLNLRHKQLNPEGKYPKLQAWCEKFNQYPSLTQTMPVA